ncbi:MAG: hypothetical protein E7256_06700 [Lachnospiraceae bacterium]|nr:hypothetical protein [Lachnospiraceae bacterium]
MNVQKTIHQLTVEDFINLSKEVINSPLPKENDSIAPASETHTPSTSDVAFSTALTKELDRFQPFQGHAFPDYKDTFYKLLSPCDYTSISDIQITRKLVLLLLLGKYTYASFFQIYSLGILGSDYTSAQSLIQKVNEKDNLIKRQFLNRGFYTDVYALTNKGLEYIKKYIPIHLLDTANIRTASIKKISSSQLEHKTSIRDVAYYLLAAPHNVKPDRLEFEFRKDSLLKPCPDADLVIGNTTLYFEQDMGTQVVSKIIDKLINYKDNDYYYSIVRPGNELSTPHELGHKSIIFLLNNYCTGSSSNIFEQRYKKYLEISNFLKTMFNMDPSSSCNLLDFMADCTERADNTHAKKLCDKYYTFVTMDSFITFHSLTIKQFEEYRKKLRSIYPLFAQDQRLSLSCSQNNKRRLTIIKAVLDYLKSCAKDYIELESFLLSGVGIYTVENTALSDFFNVNFYELFHHEPHPFGFYKRTKSRHKDYVPVKYIEYKDRYNELRHMVLRNVYTFDNDVIVAVEDISHCIDSYFRLKENMITILRDKKRILVLHFNEIQDLRLLYRTICNDGYLECIKREKLDYSNVHCYYQVSSNNYKYYTWNSAYNEFLK